VVNPPTYDTATCNGDSGGPLLAKSATNELLEIGITSVGPANCNAQTADYFTAVLPIQPWVSSQVNAVSSNPRIPRLSFADARRHVRQTLTGILGSTFSRRRNYNVACTRESAIKIRCSVSFTSGRSYYYGPVTIRYILVSDQVRWTDRYVIHRVNRHCYFQSGHRSSCRTRTRSGSW
jgi:secreted trypsin-like serine protease